MEGIYFSDSVMPHATTEIGLYHIKSIVIFFYSTNNGTFSGFSNDKSNYFQNETTPNIPETHFSYADGYQNANDSNGSNEQQVLGNLRKTASKQQPRQTKATTAAKNNKSKFIFGQSVLPDTSLYIFFYREHIYKERQQTLSVRIMERKSERKQLRISMLVSNDE